MMHKYSLKKEPSLVELEPSKYDGRKSKTIRGGDSPQVPFGDMQIDNYGRQPD